MQYIILCTGHICSGKTTLQKHLSNEIDNLNHIDISNYYKNKVKESQEEYISKHCYNTITSNKNCYVELIGNEESFNKIKASLIKLANHLKQMNIPIKLIQVELKRLSLDLTYKCIKERNPDDFADHCSVEEHWNLRFNSDARFYITNQNNIEFITQNLMENN